MTYRAFLLFLVRKRPKYSNNIIHFCTADDVFLRNIWNSSHGKRTLFLQPVYAVHKEYFSFWKKQMLQRGQNQTKIFYTWSLKYFRCWHYLRLIYCLLSSLKILETASILISRIQIERVKTEIRYTMKDFSFYKERSSKLGEKNNTWP